MRFLKKVVKGRQGLYHKADCPYKNTPFTVISNYEGFKVPEGRYRYCFYCGTKLR